MTTEYTQFTVEKPMMIWAAHYLSAIGKALMDPAPAGLG